MRAAIPSVRSLVWSLPLALAACGPVDDRAGTPADGVGHDDDDALATDAYNELNLAAGRMVLYEVQVRSANACRTDVGADWQREACSRKPAPKVQYRAAGMQCDALDDLARIKLGTLDDMLEPTSDFRQGITLRYVDEQVGATTVWLMPLFPNNDQWSIPSPCDNLGSPYAVRDYLHVSGALDRACIAQGKDEHSDEPCFGDGALDALIEQAHTRGLKVMLDVALNHFGHNYNFYDYVAQRPIRERVAAGDDLNGLWDFAATDEESSLWPEVLDTPAKLDELVARAPAEQRQLDELRQRCPALEGDHLVRAFNVWRVAFDGERARFPCDTAALEYAAPGFYLGNDRWNPSTGAGDNFNNAWVDVKFLYHREENPSHTHELVRTREYLFHVLNYWTSRGVDGFRLDHTTDQSSGLGANEWKYIISKVDYYAWRRGQNRPVFLAEEFHDVEAMNHVADVMTEGYLTDMAGRHGATKDAWRVEWIVNNMDRLGNHAFVMTALENHDEKRLLDGTGFNVWTGAGFWAIGASTRSTPMLLMGQELGESRQLDFRRSDFLRSRFVGADQYQPQADSLIGYYRSLIEARLDERNRALTAPHHRALRSRWTSSVDPRIFAQARWSDDGNVMFTFFNLWERDVAQSYYLPPDLARALHLRDDMRYRLVDVLSERQQGPCKTGAELAWEIYVAMDAATRAQWLRLERCPS